MPSVWSGAVTLSRYASQERTVAGPVIVSPLTVICRPVGWVWNVTSTYLGSSRLVVVADRPPASVAVRVISRYDVLAASRSSGSGPVIGTSLPDTGPRNGCVCVAWCLTTSQLRALGGRAPVSASVAWPRSTSCSPTANLLPSAGESITGTGAVFPGSMLSVVVPVAPAGSRTVSRAVTDPPVV